LLFGSKEEVTGSLWLPNKSMVNEATTPISEAPEGAKTGDTTLPAKEGAITSGNQKGVSAPSSEGNKEVGELKAQVDELTTKLENQRILQSQADRKARVERVSREKLEKTLAKIRSGEVSVNDEVPEGESTVERETRLEAKVKIQELFLDNTEYQEILKNDVTLKDVIKNNPFALIGNYLDAQDAADQIREKLDERVSSLRAAKTAAQPKEGIEKGEGEAFEAGAVQPQAGAPDPASTVEGPSPTEPTIDKIEESIKSRIKLA